jgi:hypothetical protein
VVGRFVGIPLYLALFQISTNGNSLCFCFFETCCGIGIAACYENEASIAEIFPYGVPVLVTSIRVLVPFIMVPVLLQIERRQEPNLFYHTIFRMFLLKMVGLS